MPPPLKPPVVREDPEKKKPGDTPLGQQPVTNQFFMNVKLDNTRVIRDLQKYLEEVINHLSSVDDCEMEISLDVRAHAEKGFSQGTVRTVSENCKTLKVEDFGFKNN